jgi:hypothetical protein
VVDEEKPAVFDSPSAIDPNSVRVVKTKTLDRRHVDTSDTRRHRDINTRDQETPNMRRAENLAKCDDFFLPALGALASMAANVVPTRLHRRAALADSRGRRAAVHRRL